MGVKLVDDLSDLQLGALIDQVPTNMDWLLRSCPTVDGQHAEAFFAHVYESTTETHAGFAVSFTAYAESAEEAFRDALRAMCKKLVN